MSSPVTTGNSRVKASPGCLKELRSRAQALREGETDNLEPLPPLPAPVREMTFQVRMARVTVLGLSHRGP